MMYCLNTGETISICNLTDCIHYDGRIRNHCIQSNPPDVLDAQRRKILRMGESKIVLLGKILNKLDSIQNIDFIGFIETLYIYNPELAIQISLNPLTYIVPCMRYIHSDKWVAVVRDYGEQMLEAKLASSMNKEVWGKVALAYPLTGV